MKLKSRKGFTLMELLIVAAIIGLLAAVAIPKYGELLEKANLGATLGNLASLRSAVSIYYGSYMVYPGTMDPRSQPKMDEIITGGMPFVKSHYPPPPNSPFGDAVTVANTSGALPASMGAGWFYCNSDGTVYVNSTAKDIKGNPYTSY